MAPHKSALQSASSLHERPDQSRPPCTAAASRANQPLQDQQQAFMTSYAATTAAGASGGTATSNTSSGGTTQAAATPSAAAVDELARVLLAIRDSVADGSMAGRLGIPILNIAVQAQLTQAPSAAAQAAVGPGIDLSGSGSAGGGVSTGTITMEQLIQAYEAACNGTGGGGGVDKPAVGGGAAGVGGVGKSKVFPAVLGACVAVRAAAGLALVAARAIRVRRAGRVTPVAPAAAAGGSAVGSGGTGATAAGRAIGKTPERGRPRVLWECLNGVARSGWAPLQRSGTCSRLLACPCAQPIQKNPAPRQLLQIVCPGASASWRAWD